MGRLFLWHYHVMSQCSAWLISLYTECFMSVEHGMSESVHWWRLRCCFYCVNIASTYSPGALDKNWACNGKKILESWSLFLILTIIHSLPITDELPSSKVQFCFYFICLMVWCRQYDYAYLYIHTIYDDIFFIMCRFWLTQFTLWYLAVDLAICLFSMV